MMAGTPATPAAVTTAAKQPGEAPVSHTRNAAAAHTVPGGAPHPRKIANAARTAASCDASIAAQSATSQRAAEEGGGGGGSRASGGGADGSCATSRACKVSAWPPRAAAATASRSSSGEDPHRWSPSSTSTSIVSPAPAAIVSGLCDAVPPGPVGDKSNGRGSAARRARTALAQPPRTAASRNDATTSAGEQWGPGQIPSAPSLVHGRTSASTTPAVQLADGPEYPQGAGEKVACRAAPALKSSRPPLLSRQPARRRVATQSACPLVAATQRAARMSAGDCTESGIARRVACPGRRHVAPSSRCSAESRPARAADSRAPRMDTLLACSGSGSDDSGAAGTRRVLEPQPVLRKRSSRSTLACPFAAAARAPSVTTTRGSASRAATVAAQGAR